MNILKIERAITHYCDDWINELDLSELADEDKYREGGY